MLPTGCRLRSIALSSVLALCACLPLGAHQDDSEEASSAAKSHLRIEDKALRSLVHRGMKESQTLRELDARLETSDVVAFVRFDSQLRSRTAGQLSFVSMVGGVRYVLIKVAFVGASKGQVALVGHELRHAVEVAEMQAIIDVSSFRREYARVGFPNPFVNTTPGFAYETMEAIRAGQQIARELRTGT